MDPNAQNPQPAVDPTAVPGVGAPAPVVTPDPAAPSVPTATPEPTMPTMPEPTPAEPVPAVPAPEVPVTDPGAVVPPTGTPAA